MRQDVVRAEKRCLRCERDVRAGRAVVENCERCAILRGKDVEAKAGISGGH